jgi:plasmid maintenance system killer protein
MNPFADQRTEDVFEGRHRKDVPDNVARRAVRQIDILLAATKLEDCRIAGRGRIAKRQNIDPPIFCCNTEGQWWVTFEWRFDRAVNIRIQDTG